MVLRCDQVRLLLDYGAIPGTPRKGMPELGFHLATCENCRALWLGTTAGESLHPQDGHQTVPGDDSPDSWFVNETTPFAAPDVYESTVLGINDGQYDTYQDIEESRQAQQWSMGGMPDPGNETHDSWAGSNAESASGRVITYGSLLRNRNFRLLWLGQAVSTFGSYFTRIAIPIYVFTLTNSYTQLGIAAFSSLVAPLLFGLFAGALVDRWDRRRTMIAVDIASAVVLVGMMAVAFLPLDLPFKLAGLYTVNLLMALLREIFNPARIAILADVVEEDELLVANSLDQGTTTFGELVSYPLAGLALFYFGPAVAFGIDALTFLVAALLIWGVRSAQPVVAKNETASILKEIGEGLRTINQVALVRKIVILSLFVPLFMSLYNTLQLPYAVDAIGSNKAVGFPLLEGSMALGFTVGVLLLGKCGQRIARTTLLAYGIAGFGLALIAQGLVPSIAAAIGLVPAETSTSPWTPLLLLAVPCAFLAGATNSLIFTSIRTILQEQTPRAMLGRVASVVSVAAGLGFAFGALLSGFAQGHVAEIITLIGGVIATTGLFCRWWFVMDAEHVVSFDLPARA